MRLTHLLDDAGVAALATPRDDLVAETAGADPHSFDLAQGPFDHYRRHLEVTPVADGRYEVTEQIDYHLAVPVWRVLLAWPVRRVLRRPPRDAMPWWAPPDRFDARAARVVASLCSMSVLAGYLGSLLSQTISPAADEFGVSNTTQGDVVALTRIGVFIAIGVTVAADRRGRRPLLLVAATVSCVLAVATAVTPSVWAYGATQTVSRGLATAMAVLIGVVAAEETPARSRAYVVSVLALCAGLGSGMVLWFLPLADVAVWGWRLLFVVPALGVAAVALVARTLPETRRFEVSVPLTPRPLARDRLVLLATVALFASAFAAPASNFMNDFLREDRGFSNTDVTVFQLLVNTPVGIGVLIGGRLADLRGRRVVGAVAFIVGAAAVTARYNTDGTTMWLVAVVGSVVGAAAVPALGVYSFELFGTSRRAQSNGYVTLAGVTGSAAALVFAGRAADSFGFGATFQLLLVAPAVVAVLVLTRYPETAGLELEDINPDDRAPADAPAAAPTGGVAQPEEPER